MRIRRLHFPDFRGFPRSGRFQLVTQVAGRTGRGPKGGRVLVQTSSPEHPAIQAAVLHDYLMFATRELPTREQFGYPPYTAMLRLIVRGPNETHAEQFAELIADRMRSIAAATHTDVRVLGPAPCPIAKLRGKSRFHTLVHGIDAERLAGHLSRGGSRPEAADQCAVGRGCRSGGYAVIVAVIVAFRSRERRRHW